MIVVFSSIFIDIKTASADLTDADTTSLSIQVIEGVVSEEGETVVQSGGYRVTRPRTAARIRELLRRRFGPFSSSSSRRSSAMRSGFQSSVSDTTVLPAAPVQDSSTSSVGALVVDVPEPAIGVTDVSEQTGGWCIIPCDAGLQCSLHALRCFCQQAMMDALISFRFPTTAAVVAIHWTEPFLWFVTLILLVLLCQAVVWLLSVVYKRLSRDPITQELQPIKQVSLPIAPVIQKKIPKEKSRKLPKKDSNVQVDVSDVHLPWD